MAAGPDREAKPEEWGYRPADNERVEVNPPALSWVPATGAKRYTVQMASNLSFRDAIVIGSIPWTVYTHNKPLKPGPWYWRYQADGGEWSRARRFEILPTAVEFPQPTMEELRRRVPNRHPRMFARPEDRERLRAALPSAEGKRLLQAADRLVTAEPTPEPKVKANSKDPETNQFWWSNRVQTVKALQEAEVLAFAWWLTGDDRYGQTARRFTLKLASWDPDGPTNFTVNCEAAKPMLHRMARAYDFGYGLFTEDERSRIRAMLLRRANDAWVSGEAKRGVGHLAEPYGSHANRLWHKLAENAIATLGETPESDQFLEYAVTKFFAAYPVWSDDDGGWHEGLSYFGGYMSKATWWFHIARTALGIDGFKKPFFKHFGDYPLYSTVPGSPNGGFGDLSSRPISSGWAFMDFFVRETRNPYWAWWTQASGLRQEADELVLGFLWSARPDVEAKAPVDLPPSKLFRGTGVAVMNTTLLGSTDNVQVRFKASPMGRWSHGHDPHNSFTLNAYGEALLVNNVYRDIYGSPFHAKWVWSTRAQNAVLVNGEGQQPHSAALGGRILKTEFRDGFDYVVGDATASYEGRLKRAVRHVLFLKPDLVVLVDELEAAKPSTFQWMLHGLEAFTLQPEQQRLELKRAKAGVLVDYIADQPLTMRQWTGYEPDVDHRYLESIKSPGIPAQWHVEATSGQPALKMYGITVMRPYRSGAKPIVLEQQSSGDQVILRAGGHTVTLFKEAASRDVATVSGPSGSHRIAR